MKRTKMSRVSVSLTDPQQDFLAVEAELRGISVAELIRRIIDEYRDRKSHRAPGA